MVRVEISTRPVALGQALATEALAGSLGAELTLAAEVVTDAAMGRVGQEIAADTSAIRRSTAADHGTRSVSADRVLGAGDVAGSAMLSRRGEIDAAFATGCLSL